MHGSFEKSNVISRRLVTRPELAKLADVRFGAVPHLVSLLDLAENADLGSGAGLNLSAAWGPSVGDDVPSFPIR
jgi:hypothetical protein